MCASEYNKLNLAYAAHVKQEYHATSSTLYNPVYTKEGADSSRYATITLNEEPYHALVAN